MKIKAYLADVAAQNKLEAEPLQFPDCTLDPARIKVIMISEVPPQNPDDGFYSVAPDSAYVKSALGLFAAGGVQAGSIRDILDMGIYITTAVKSPKNGYAVDPEILNAQLPLLEAELALFPNLRAIMLMGDVAKKAVNIIAKAKTKKNIVPSQATYKIRGNAYYWGDVRVLPSYIMTGKNLLIEPFKRDTIAEDIRRMMEIIA